MRTNKVGQAGIDSHNRRLRNGDVQESPKENGKALETETGFVVSHRRSKLGNILSTAAVLGIAQEQARFSRAA